MLSASMANEHRTHHKRDTSYAKEREVPYSKMIGTIAVDTED